MEAHAILSQLPWRHPFLMIDRMIECTPHARIVTLKNVSAGDPLTRGAGLDSARLPSVLLLEGMGQTAALLYRLTFEDEEARLPLLGFLKASLYDAPPCGVGVHFHVRALKMTRRGGLFEGQARLGESLLAEAELGFSHGREAP